MDKRIEEIMQGFQRLLKGVEGSFIATVDKDKTDTVNVKDLNGTLYPDVRKIATSGKKGFVPMLPRGSYVIVSRISKSDDLFIGMMTEIESIALDVNDSIVINGGENDGLVKIRNLENNLDKLHDLIGQLADNIYTWGTALDTVAGGAVTTGKTAWELLAGSFRFEDMEDKKIKH